MLTLNEGNKNMTPSRFLQYQKPKLIEKNLQPVPVNQQPLTYAQFSNNAYYPGQNTNDIPEGFAVLDECPEEFQWWGYFGKSYFKINKETKTIDFIIAHRGTDNNFGIVEDAKLWLAEVLPAQYAEGAKPFMQQTIKKMQDIVARENDLAGFTINYQVTGHSLGAALGELTMIDSAQGNILDEKGQPIKMTGFLVENPGVPYETEQKILDANQSKGEVVPEEEIGNYICENTVLLNNRPDAINTLFPTPSNYQYRLDIDNREYPRFLGIPLPLLPSLFYYAYPYSFNVVHPDANIVTYLKANGSDSLKNLGPWPYGLMRGFHQWENYGLNTKYWDGYLKQLWMHNGVESTIIQCMFGKKYNEFSEFYITHFLNVHALSENDSKQLHSQGVEKLQNMLTVAEGVNPADAMWEQLSWFKRQKFNNDRTKFDAEINNLLDKLTPKQQPIVDAVLAAISAQLKILVANPKNKNPENKKRFNALIYLQHELQAAKITNTPINKEQVQLSIDEVNSKYQITIHQVFNMKDPKVDVLDRIIQLYQESQPEEKKKTEDQRPVDVYSEDMKAVARYKMELLRCLSDILTNNRKLPKNSDKYVTFENLRHEINKTTEMSDLKIYVNTVREIASIHRNQHGVTGFVNRFFHRHTKSQDILDKYFDANNDMKNAPTSKTRQQLRT